MPGALKATRSKLTILGQAGRQAGEHRSNVEEIREMCLHERVCRLDDFGVEGEVWLLQENVLPKGFEEGGFRGGGI